MTIRVLLAISDDEVMDSMLATLAEVGDVEHHGARSAEDAATVLAMQPGIDVILVDEQVGRSSGLDVIRDLAARAPLAGVLLLATRPEAHTLNEAMASGARSVIAKPFSVEEVWSILEAVAAWARTARSQVLADGPFSGSTAGAGKVLAITGAKGGSGATVVAMMLAIAYSETLSVCIIDFDLQTGDVGPYAGIRTTRSVVDLVEISGELTGRALREMSYDLPEGIKLFPAPALGERGEEMTGLATRNVLSALRQQFDVIIVDCGARLDDAGAMAIELADVAVIVATADIPALRSARSKLGLWERLNVRTGADTGLVLNRASSKREVQSDLAATIVGLDIIGTIPDGGQALESVMNTATLLSDRNTAVHLVVAELAVEIGRRWFGRVGSSGDDRSGSRWSRTRRSKGKPLPVEPPLMTTAIAIRPGLMAQTAPDAQHMQLVSEPLVRPQPPAQQVPQLQVHPVVDGHPDAQPHVPRLPQPPAMPPEPVAPTYPPSYAPQGSRKQRDSSPSTHGLDDSGQSAVQLPFIAGFMLVLLLIGCQLLLFGATHMIAQNSAGEAARWVGAGASNSVVHRDFKDTLPGLWQQGAQVTTVSHGTQVEVTIQTPRIVPGGSLEVTMRAPILREPL